MAHVTVGRQLQVGAGLSGAKNGINRVFTTPTKFVHAAGLTIEVFHNGRRLKQAPSDDVRLGEYYAFESGGSGTGFDSIGIMAFIPNAMSELTANYTQA